MKCTQMLSHSQEKSLTKVSEAEGKVGLGISKNLCKVPRDLSYAE